MSNFVIGCYGCGIKHGSMYLNHDIDKNKLCRKCWKHYYYHGLVAAKYRLIRMYTHGKSYYFKGQKIRSGKCQKCGKIGKTHLHHEAFDELNPLAYTIELCQSCHNKESLRLGQIKGRTGILPRKGNRWIKVEQWL